MSLSRGGDGESDREVGLAGPGWSEQDDVARLVQVGPRRQCRDGASNAVLDLEVEVLEALARGQAGGADAQLGPRGLARTHLAL